MSRKPYFRTFLAASILGLSGCGPRPVELQVTVKLESAAPEHIREAAYILASRFAELRPALFAQIEAIPGPSSVELVFRGYAPEEPTIRMYAETQGVYRLYPEGKRTNLLVSDLDIETVNAVSGTEGIALDFTLREAGAQRLKDYTSRNPGGVLITTWDRQEVSRARVMGTLSRQFQTTGLNPETAHGMAVILRHGRLPVQVSGIEIRRPTP